MKKSLVVLLIAVLVAGYAFAAPTFAGTVSATATYDLADSTFTYATDNTLEASFTFADTLSKNAIGTAYPYINVAGSVKLTGSLEGQTVKQALKLDTFEVVGEGWKLNLLAKSGQFDYAVSAIDTLDVQTTQFGAPVASPYTLSWGVKDNAGIAYTNDNFGTIFVTGAMTDGGDFAVAEAVAQKAEYGDDRKQTAWTDGKDTEKWERIEKTEAFVDKTTKWITVEDYEKAEWKYEVVTSNTNMVKVHSSQKSYDYVAKAASSDSMLAQVEAQTKVLAITDALSAQFAAGFCFEDLDSYTYGASAKFAYNDVAAIAADFGCDVTREDEPWFFDVAGSLKVGVFTFDGYFATEGAVADEDPVLGTDAYDDLPDDLYLSLKAVAEIEEIGTTFTATAQDIFALYDGKYSVEAVNAYIPGYTFTVGISNDSDEMFWASAEAEYENGLSLGLGATFEFGTYIPATVEASIGYTSDEFEVSFEGAYDFDDLEATLLSTFHADKFDVVGNAYYNTKAKKGAGVTCNYSDVEDGLFVEAGIKTDKLVDGADFSLMYKSDKIATPYTLKNGAIEAGLTVTIK